MFRIPFRKRANQEDSAASGNGDGSAETEIKEPWVIMGTSFDRGATIYSFVRNLSDGNRQVARVHSSGRAEEVTDRFNKGLLQATRIDTIPQIRRANASD